MPFKTITSESQILISTAVPLKQLKNIPTVWGAQMKINGKILSSHMSFFLTLHKTIDLINNGILHTRL